MNVIQIIGYTRLKQFSLKEQYKDSDWTDECIDFFF